jgi:hypothetical protein
MTPTRSILCTLALAAFVLPVPLAPAKAQQPPGAIEKRISEGWEVAGYIAAWENRTLILFKHKEHKYLVQCSVLIDVMHKPPLVTACNELK